ncbi:uncharacterized protein LOC141514338 isoform X3 [Macrotis lagotis]|uniref:uncharacterized protein LOC141514338 isoform X3 n=1 Tax=Macrotis lagotis TaxID=92651 RepID=UPI003D687E10
MALPPATGYPVCICRLLPTFLAAEEVTLSFIPGHLEGSASAPEGRGLPFAPEEPSVFPRNIFLILFCKVSPSWK